MKNLYLASVIVLSLSVFSAGCSSEPDPNETGGVVKGLPAAGAPDNATKPSNPFAGAPAMPGGGKKGVAPPAAATGGGGGGTAGPN